MKKFVMQVKTWKPTGVCETFEEQWVDVKPSGGRRYEYDTEAEAASMLRVCYGDPQHSGKARVIPVEV